MNKALLSSKNMCWCTPQDFFDKLNEEFSFTLDAAATDKTAKCPLYFTPETDGLKSSWKGYSILQSPVWARNRKVGSKGIRRGAGRNTDCPSYSGAYRYKLFPRFYIPQSGNSLYSWAASVYGRRRQRRRSRALPLYAGDLQRKGSENMSYDIELCEPIGGEVIQFETPHMIRGGTYAIYGTQEAWLNITYNYGKHYRRVFGENGIRTIYGMTGAESIPIIKAAMEKLSDDISEDYWEATEGNAKKALAGLLAFAQMRPDGVWKGD